jgi:hypothetical protein
VLERRDKTSCVEWALLALFLIAPGSALSKGSSIHSGDGYNPDHISSLPPEVRDTVLTKCADARALHNFSRLRHGASEIEIHYEHMICGVRDYCTPGKCLHEIYRQTEDGHYRLVGRYYGHRFEKEERY